MRPRRNMAIDLKPMKSLYLIHDYLNCICLSSRTQSPYWGAKVDIPVALYISIFRGMEGLRPFCDGGHDQ